MYVIIKEIIRRVGVLDEGDVRLQLTNLAPSDSTVVDEWVAMIDR